MADEESYQLKLAVFEGPFDLLLYLIKKNQIDIYDIPIANITQEYLSYIDMMTKLNLDVASEFIVIAATLIYIKAKMLLPKDELLEANEEDPRTELVQHLVEYSQFKEIAERMRIYEAKKRDLFERLYPINIAKEEQELVLDVYAIVKAMDSVLDRIKERKQIIIPGEQIRVKDRIYEIIGSLRKTNDAISFFALVSGDRSRIYIIALFLAILELLRLKVISVTQDRLFDDIKIQFNDPNFDESILMNIGE
ncbi:MAG: segregation/condensation protein A [Spirochaetia bacterium]|nr:segregation/condensation protein A [Spirochaetia bacterium]